MSNQKLRSKISNQIDQFKSVIMNKDDELLYAIEDSQLTFINGVYLDESKKEATVTLNVIDDLNAREIIVYKGDHQIAKIIFNNLSELGNINVGGFDKEGVFWL